MNDPYAVIHHFDGTNKMLIDDDGDTRDGWYFQFIGDNHRPITSLFGPYGTNKECEDAAIREWIN